MTTKAVGKARLRELEDVIASGFKTFIEVGTAISEIHDDELYKESGHLTFADYVDRRWGWTRDQGYKQMRGAEVGRLLVANVYRGIQPNAERQVRPLTEVPKERWVEAWQEAVQLSNEDRGINDPKDWRPPLERHVRFVVNEIHSPRRRAKAKKLEELGRFNVILCDPPWRYDYSFSNSRAIEKHYPTMDMAGLMGMSESVRAVASKDSVMFMWCPPAFTRKGIILMRAWGFSYRTNMVWVKPSIGAGQWVRQQHEMLLLGMRGTYPTPDGPLRPSSVMEAARGEHSEKPPIVYGLIEQMYPDAKRVELFARGVRRGWTSWGDEITLKT